MGKPSTDDDLEETRRIMERLVRTPPKPHKDKGGEKPTGKRSGISAKPKGRKPSTKNG